MKSILVTSAEHHAQIACGPWPNSVCPSTRQSTTAIIAYTQHQPAACMAVTVAATAVDARACSPKEAYTRVCTYPTFKR